MKGAEEQTLMTLWWNLHPLLKIRLGFGMTRGDKIVKGFSLFGVEHV
jgi:hypothetical protein